jgi:hypothetical protein
MKQKKLRWPVAGTQASMVFGIGKLDGYLSVLSITIDVKLRLHIPLMTISEVDEQVGRLAQTLRLLRSRRNELAPISALASEVMLGIFMHLLDFTSPVKIRDKRRGAVPLHQTKIDQLHITHVCRSWRWLTIHSPVLWSNISFHCHPLLTEELLRRSQGALLDITLDRDYSRILRSSSVIPSAFTNPMRIRTIDISGDNSLFDRILPSLQHPSWPVLEELRLSCSESRTEFPGAFLNAVVPRLRRLLLSGIKYSLHSYLFDNLTFLHMANTKYRLPSTGEEPPRPSWPELNSVFRRSTHLRELHLLRYLPHGWPMDDERTVISMSALHTVCLVDKSSRVIQFLARTSMPSLQHRQFVVYAEDDFNPIQYPQMHANEEHRIIEEPCVVTFAEALNRHLEAYPLLQLNRVELGLPTIDIQAWSPRSCDRPEIHLKIECFYQETPGCIDHFDFAQTLLSLSSFSNITTFTIRPELPFPPYYSQPARSWIQSVDFRKLFRILPHIRTFQIGSHVTSVNYTYISRAGFAAPDGISSMSGLIHALEANDGFDPVPHPYLEELALEYLDFSPIPIPWEQNLNINSESNMIADLLSSRADAGFPLSRLRIQQCIGVSEDMVQGWRSKAEILWDGPVYIPPKDDGWSDW